MYTLSSNSFSLSTLKNIIYEELKIKLSEEVKQKIVSCRNYLDEKIATTVDLSMALIRALVLCMMLGLTRKILQNYKQT